MSNNIIMFFNTNTTQTVNNMKVDFNAEDAQIINCTVQLTSALNYNTFAPYDSVTCTIINRSSADNTTSNLESNISAAEYLRVGTKINGTGNYVAVGPLFKINSRSEIGGGRWKIQGYSLVEFMNSINVKAMFYTPENITVSQVVTDLFNAVNFPGINGCFCNIQSAERVYGYTQNNSARNIYGQISLAYGLHTGYNASCLTNGTLVLAPANTSSSISTTVGNNNIYVGNNTTVLDKSYSVNIVGYNYRSAEMETVCVYDQKVTDLPSWGNNDNFQVNFTQSIDPNTALVLTGIKKYSDVYDTSHAWIDSLNSTYPGCKELAASNDYYTWGIIINGVSHNADLPAEVTENDLFDINTNRKYQFRLISQNNSKNSFNISSSNTIAAMVELSKNCPNSEQNALNLSGNGLNSSWRLHYSEEKQSRNIYFSRIYWAPGTHRYRTYLYYGGQGAVNIHKYLVDNVTFDGLNLYTNFPLPWSDSGVNNSSSVHNGNLQIYGKALEYNSTLSCTYQNSGMPTVFYHINDIQIITSENNSNAAMSCVCSRVVNYAKCPRIEKFSYPWDGQSRPGEQLKIENNFGLITETTIVLSSFPKSTSTVRIDYTGR